MQEDVSNNVYRSNLIKNDTLTFDKIYVEQSKKWQDLSNDNR